ncbi:MAG: methyltransferase domain-containing protein [Patescibacteria group bacterium]
MGVPDLEKIRREVLRDASGIVLEIGVGPGYNLPLYHNISKLYALEPSEELTEIAKSRAKDLPFPIEFLKSGAENIPLSDASLDTVVSTWTLCSVTDPENVLREIVRVLKPHGRFIFADHGASPNFGIRILQIAATSVTKFFTGNCHYDRPLGKLLREAGFTIEKMEHPQEGFRPLVYSYRGIASPASHHSDSR